ncbi:hypothetical protein [Streptomyces chrestomyceticus]
MTVDGPIPIPDVAVPTDDGAQRQTSDCAAPAVNTAYFDENLTC